MTKERSPRRLTPKQQQRVLEKLDKFIEMHPAGKFCHRCEHCCFWQDVLKEHAKLPKGKRP